MSFAESKGLLTSLFSSENRIQNHAMSMVEADDDMPLHLNLVARGMHVLFFLCHERSHANEDELTIRQIGTRLSNSIAAALRLSLIGYFQAAILQQRDILEIAFLLDLMRTDRSVIGQWREADDKRWKLFNPKEVRDKLDRRDGITNGKRKLAYDTLCLLGGHVNNDGFRMFMCETPDGGKPLMGPMMENRRLSATLYELAKMTLESVEVFTKFFDWQRHDLQENISRVKFVEAAGVWLNKFFNRPYDPDEANWHMTVIHRWASDHT